MKKVVLIAVLFSMVTLSAKAQWFALNEVPRSHGQ